MKARRDWLYRIAAAVSPQTARDHRAAYPIVVAGLLSSQVGMGEGARLCAEALSLLGHNVQTVDLSGPFGRRELRGEVKKRGKPHAGAGTLILHLNADQFPLGLALIGRRATEGKRIIGYWSWELSRMPENWSRALGLLDEIWVPSKFVADAVRPFTTKPVRVVPHPVAVCEPGVRGRSKFGLSEDAFVVALVFDVASSFARKNPVTGIAAFRQAFGDDPRYQLAIKESGIEGLRAEGRQLRDAIGNAKNITVLSANWTRQEMADFIACVDVLLSPHRSEGFGLALAHAMLSRTIVVASGWSGNLDFMDNESSVLIAGSLVNVTDPQGCYSDSRQLWFEPNVEAIVAALRDLSLHREKALLLKDRASKLVQEKLGLSAYADATRGALPQSQTTSDSI